MNILDTIKATKIKEVDERKELYPVKLLERSIYFMSPVVSLKKYLMRDDKIGIIAEIKRKSPSKGMINQHVSVERTSIGYMMAGASALSVLTDTQYFGGKNEDLTTARKFNYCPILRKDFIIDEYQVMETKSIGADVMLLIAGVNDEKRTLELAKLAKLIGLEVILEIHNENEISFINEYIDIVGVNNRNLKDFSVDINHSYRIAEHLPKEMIKISESAIGNAKTLIELKQAGFRGFLIGEQFMKHSRPEAECAAFVKEVQRLQVA